MGNSATPEYRPLLPCHSCWQHEWQILAVWTPGRPLFDHRSPPHTADDWTAETIGVYQCETVQCDLHGRQVYGLVHPTRTP